MTETDSQVIAIDGPAAAGKGTLARKLAAHFGFAYLDTGALYRAVAAKIIASGADLSDDGGRGRGAEAVPSRFGA